MSDSYKFGLIGVGDNVQLGKRGNRIKATPSGVAMRNAADDDFVRLQVADGVSPEDAVSKSQMEAAISASLQPDALVYKGTFDASAGNYTALDNASQGDFYKISVAGTIGSYDWAVGDNLIVNKDVTGTPLEADIDKIDNTESADILRTGDISTDTDFNNEPTKIADRATIKSYVETQVGAGDRTALLTFDASSPVNIGAVAPSGSRAKRAYISVNTAFDGTTESTVEIGIVGDTASIASSTEVDLHQVGEYEMTCNQKFAADTQIIATYVADGATQGEADIVVELVI